MICESAEVMMWSCKATMRVNLIHSLQTYVTTLSIQATTKWRTNVDQWAYPLSIMSKKVTHANARTHAYKLCQQCQITNQQTSSQINCVASKVNKAAVERMLYFLLFVLLALATCLLIQHLLKAVPQMDWSCHTKNICVHTHTLQNAHHFFHVNLYHGIKHDCGKTCVYNSNVYNICIYIYNFKYTIYLIFFPYETSMQKTRVW